MNTVRVHLHHKSFKYKPSSSETGLINNEITQSVSSISVSDLAKKVGEEGHTICLATMNGSRSKLNMIQQQVIMIDFDNDIETDKKDENGKKIKVKAEGLFYTSIADILNDEFILSNASFIYKSFRYKESWEKFRVVFVLDKPIIKDEQIESIYRWLQNKYPNADKSCKDSSRLFFGGKQKVIPINDYQNAFAVTNEILNYKDVSEVKEPKRVTKIAKAKESKAVSVRQAQKSKPNVTSSEKPTWLLIKEGNKEAVKERLSCYGATVHSKVQAKRLLKSIDMRNLLGIDESNPFLDILHDETKPSAGIFKMEEADIYLYKCFSDSSEFTGDVLIVVGKLLGIGYIKALNYLIEVTNIKIEMTEQILEIRDQCDIYTDLLLSPDLKKLYPAVYNKFWRYKSIIASLLTIFKENIIEDENGNLRSLTYMSSKTLALSIYGNENKCRTIERVLNLLCDTEWIEKLDDSEIPPKILKLLKNRQRQLKAVRRNNVFELFLHGNDFFLDLNKRCELMIKQGHTMKGQSREYSLRTHGKEKADKVYVQDKGRDISVISKAITKDIHKIALKQIEKKGYILERELLDKLRRKWKSKGFTEYKLKQAISEMLDLYDLQRKRMTKDLKEKFGVTNLSSKQSPFTLIKNS